MMKHRIGTYLFIVWLVLLLANPALSALRTVVLEQATNVGCG